MKQILPAWLICILYWGWENALLNDNTLLFVSPLLIMEFLQNLSWEDYLSQAMLITGPPNIVYLQLLVPQGAKRFFNVYPH